MHRTKQTHKHIYGKMTLGKISYFESRDQNLPQAMFGLSRLRLKAIFNCLKWLFIDLFSPYDNNARRSFFMHISIAIFNTLKSVHTFASLL